MSEPYVPLRDLGELAELNPGHTARELRRLQLMAQLLDEDDEAAGYEEPRNEIAKARCYGCGKTFELQANEWFCSDTCHDAYPDEWPKTRY